MNRDKIRYRMEMKLLAEELGGCYFAYYPTLGEFTIYGMGGTQAEALANLDASLEETFAFWSKRGIKIPEPTDEDLGRLALVAADVCLASDDNYAYAA